MPDEHRPSALDPVDLMVERATELAGAANTLSTARYLLADEATARAIAADGRAQALQQTIADHLAAISGSA